MSQYKPWYDVWHYDLAAMMAVILKEKEAAASLTKGGVKWQSERLRILSKGTVRNKTNSLSEKLVLGQIYYFNITNAENAPRVVHRFVMAIPIEIKKDTITFIDLFELMPKRRLKILSIISYFIASGKINNTVSTRIVNSIKSKGISRKVLTYQVKDPFIRVDVGDYPYLLFIDRPRS